MGQLQSVTKVQSGTICSLPAEGLMEVFSFLSFGLARREKFDKRASNMQGSTIKLPKQIEPKDLMRLRDSVLASTLLHSGSGSSSDISHHLSIILATVVCDIP